ncbi:MAG: Gfo/Idh/MocA family oxidoreductase [Verrucomicrobia bacterium]|nr:Gfo/Idh/MocA family oxidoreductase [Verrucomicrobiota bacterium]MCG2680669.1 Gfo/Idh/MocA family oxidoreductase [Kiritimatiellia bacterium]MBU4247196.1 Gfo/Idh/MocA family oxidoreductase [Verrucomicrobiota bacterium]MBU4291367.1 Gfo/Idh/MocA family oxidoreductase [Verrucomicrobiota bacterium]MBU4428163.1 Gfo/Idh/MocA family oxidoreductase [Verrucomicrobiota bacterium]
MKELRTAVLGLGRIGWQFHLPRIHQHAGFNLVAVVDPLPDRLKEARTVYGVKGYADCDALFAAETPDLIVVASPTSFHADQTIAAFRHGSDVFCDKPMAVSLGEADRMIGVMAECRRKLMVYQPHRATAEVVALQDILRQDLIGRVYMIKRTCTDYTRRNDWQAFRKNFGGMLNNYGAHYIDQLLYLSQSPVKRATCSLRTIASLGDADDVVKAVLETENGMLLDVDINMAAAVSMRPWHILGQRGAIVLSDDTSAWHVCYYRPEDLPVIPVQDGLAAAERRYGSGEKITWQELMIPISDFKPVDFYAKCYDYFALNRDPFVPVTATRELMRVIDLCRQDAR